MKNVNSVKVMSAKYGFSVEDNSWIVDRHFQLFEEEGKLFLWECEYRTSGGWESSVWDKSETEDEISIEEFNSYVERCRKEAEEDENTHFYEVK